MSSSQLLAEAKGKSDEAVFRGNPSVRGERETAAPMLECGAATKLSRRESHPERGATYELQTYVCTKCGAIVTRDVPTPGAT
jgi:hypothetical protein